MDPVLVNGRPGLSGGVGPGVGPFERQSAVEMLDLSVGLRAVGPGVFVFDVGPKGLVEGLGTVAGSVIR